MSDQEQNTPAPEGTTSAQEAFDIFDDQSAVKKKAEEKKKQEAQKNKDQGKGQSRQEKPKPKFAAGTPLHYSGHKLELPSEMDAEAIFAWLSDDFPELSSDRADVREDKAKERLVIDLKSFKKGAGPAEILARIPGPDTGGGAPPSPVRRVKAPDGFYEIRTTSIGAFVAAAPDERIAKLGTAVAAIPHVASAPREGFYPALPKAPSELLERTVAIFAEIPEHEAVVNVVYDRTQGRYHLIWTEQRDATSGSVTYDPIPETDRFVPYAEIHSHNRMTAFWSATDDAHEVRTLLYGVVGRVDAELPEAAFRLFCGGIFLPLRASEIFTADAASTGGPHLQDLVEDVSHDRPERLARLQHTPEEPTT